MTEEEYLIVHGWTCSAGHTYRTLDKVVFDPWEHPRFGVGLSLAEAVKAQLTEDRRLYNFVRERSIVENGMLFAAPH